MADTPTRIRLGDPGALVAAIPHLLGFTPLDSVVAVGLRRPRSRVCLTLRLDLAAALDHALLATVAAHLRRANATEFVVVVAGSPAWTTGPPGSGPVPPSPPGSGAVPPSPPGSGPVPASPPGSGPVPPSPPGSCAAPPSLAGPLPYRAEVQAMREICERRRLVLRDALWVHQGRWRSYLCPDPSCCPPGGTPVDASAAGELAAELALSGRCALPDRAALERSVAGDFPLGEAVAARLFAAASARDGESPPDGRSVARGEPAPEDPDAVLSAAVQRCVPGGPGVVAGDRARLCVLLSRPAVRDRALRWLGGPLHDAAQTLWQDLTRAAPPPWAAAPAALLALYVYARGDGAFARVCADRALADDPDHRLAGLVHEMLDHAVGPAEVAAAARLMARRRGSP
ncbi:MAG TPA: DUF4192 domain-containing protein [Mycobacteriales bacterium]